MSQKSIPVSVRISPDDAEFLAQLQLQDAVTPSDKIRHIIRTARERYERSNDYKGHFRTSQELIAPALELIKSAEIDNKTYSELMGVVTEWLTETVAFLTASATPQDNQQQVNLGTLEKGIAERLFRLFEQIMRMGITQQAPCYDKDVIQKNISPVLQLAELINAQQRSEE